MKRLLLCFLAAISLAACDNTSQLDKLVRECPNGDVYKKHSYKMLPYSEDEHGWFTEECKNCGLKKKFCDGLAWPKHYGAVCLYMNPETGNYDTYYVEYMDLDTQTEHFEHVTEDELTKATDSDKDK